MTKMTRIATTLMIAAFAFTATIFADEVKIQTSSHCGMCKDKIEKGLNKINGVEKADLDLNSKIVTVNFDSKKTNAEELRSKVEKLGYTASFIGDKTITETKAEVKGKDCKHDMKDCKHDMKDCKHDMKDCKHDMKDCKHDMKDCKNGKDCCKVTGMDCKDKADDCCKTKTMNKKTTKTKIKK